jgi:glycosyltransferase involved in cell wall biosynthesis
MPSFNHEKYISEAIESVLNQSFKDFELIILDDCSKDSSQKIIQSYQRKDSRIRALFHKKNMGIAKTANDLLAEAKGTYVALFASDDIWETLKLEKQLAILEKNDSLIVWSEGILIDNNGVPTGETFTQKESALHKKKSGNLFESLISRNFIFGSSVILKRSIIEGIQFCEELKYYNDCKFYVDLSRNHLFFFIPEPLARYRVHGKNAHVSDEKGWRLDEIAFGQLILREYGNYISNRTKAEWLWLVGSAYSYFSEKADARRTIFNAIILNPFCKNNFSYLLLALTNGNDCIAKFFVAFRSYCFRIFSSARPFA